MNNHYHRGKKMGKKGKIKEKKAEEDLEQDHFHLHHLLRIILLTHKTHLLEINNKKRKNLAFLVQ